MLYKRCTRLYTNKRTLYKQELSTRIHLITLPPPAHVRMPPVHCLGLFLWCPEVSTDRAVEQAAEAVTFQLTND